MHGLEYEPALLALNVDDPSGAQDLRALALHHITEPVADLAAVHGLARGQRDAADPGVVLVVMVMPLVVVVMIAMLIVHMAFFTMCGIEEVGLERDDAVDVEAAAA